MVLENDFNEARVSEAAEHVRKKLNASFEPYAYTILRDCPAFKKGLTNSETQLAIIRALGLMVLDGTQRMAKLLREVEEYEGENQ